MNAALYRRRSAGDYLTMAQRLVTETADLLNPGRTIAQSPNAFEAMRAKAISLKMCGGHGWLFVFSDLSAIMTSNDADYIWPHWVVS